MKNVIITVLAILGFANIISAQERLLLKPDSLFSLAEKNSRLLDISRYKISMSSNVTTIEKQKAYLPELGASFTYGYLSNGHVWDNHFNYENTVKVPHTSMDFSLEAGYTVFNGNASKNRIAKAELEEQIAQLNFQKDKEDIQFLLLAKYLDLSALHNQEQVYQENITLAEKRIFNIGKLIEQGMLTHNDKVRSELQLTEIKQKLDELRNNISIINHDLNTVLGLPKGTIIEPDTLTYSKDLPLGGLDKYEEGFAERIPELKAAAVHSQISEKQVNIAKSGRLPSLSLFAGDAISRPFLNAMPPIDIYMHLFQAGIKVRYDIGSLYKSKNLIQQAKMEETLSRKNEALMAEKTEMDIHAAYIKLKDAEQKYISQKESYRLAKDNYRVVEQKYLNKFAVITDMLDASTSLLSAQINMSNARIGIIYQYYNLLKTSGLWKEATN
ncbi:TolC family protein [Chryseobacterium sp. G0240]|uniref:TolC family protein n=1 Tax=Chryseobacterium sp. G0240 TaxID=2487066 RepID=UPI000F45C636|nr:TolC family protein [Chryseobacterium sp. G0240]ROI03244.1 TolC family protein [Chryseobacterium sp. G0240]